MTAMTAGELEAFLRDEFPQIQDLGLRVEDLRQGFLRVRLPVTDRHLRPGGTVSGPTLMTVADAAMYLLVLSCIGRVPLAMTTGLSINFLRPPALRDVLADTRMLKLGRQLAVGEVTLYSDGDDSPIAHASVTYAIPRREWRPAAQDGQDHTMPAPG